jgi:predicted nucleotide-binding protein (sugar kinase/HSP70/actin superfamily)
MICLPQLQGFELAHFAPEEKRLLIAAEGFEQRSLEWLRRLPQQQWFDVCLQEFLQRRVEKRLVAPFRPLLGEIAEPSIAELLKVAEPYIHPSFEGEASVSIGKTIEFYHRGYHGVINVMPFGCMPSTVVGGVMKRLQETLGNMPTLAINYDGHGDPTLQTRLEAFVHQVRACQESGRRHP